MCIHGEEYRSECGSAIIGNFRVLDNWGRDSGTAGGGSATFMSKEKSGKAPNCDDMRE